MAEKTIKPTQKSAQKFLIGKKARMTQIFDEEGRVHAVTEVKVSPSIVITQKTKEKDGYNAVVLGFGSRKEKNIKKPQKGQMKGLGNFEVIKEFRVSDAISKNAGDTVDATIFTPGEKLTITSISKGKGFQGVVKRHGFKGGPRSHGQKHSEREPGSIGGGGRDGGRVAKGMRMAGRAGGDRVTVKNLKVVLVNPEENSLFIKGAVPGSIGTLVEIRA